MKKLWEHQARALAQLDLAVKQGQKRICITSPTGGGKSLMMIRRLLASGSASIYTHRKMLLRQMAANLEREGVGFGVRAAGHRKDLAESIQLSMVQTEVNAVLKHGSREPHQCAEIHIDEAHNNANGKTLELLDLHKGVRIGWTATPLSIGHAYDHLIVAGVNSELRKAGAHVAAYHYGPDEPSKALIGNVKIGEGECGINRNKRGAFAKRVFGSVVENYRKLNPEQKPTLLFAPGVAESIWFCETLADNGITAAHIDGEHCWLDGELLKTTDEIKDEIAARCQSGSIKIVCNRFVLREGVDWPFIAHGIFATVFGSITAYLQSGGRLLRAHDSMDRVTIQDHGGNWWRHGSLNADRQWDLSQTNAIVNSVRMETLRQKPEDQPISCVQCGGVRMGGLKCAHCGHEYKSVVRRRPVLQVDGTLKPMAIGQLRPRRHVDDTQRMRDKWRGMVLGNAKHKPERTLSQIAANFSRLNDWKYPGKEFPLTPTKVIDWFRPIGNIDFNELRG